MTERARTTDVADRPTTPGPTFAPGEPASTAELPEQVDEVFALLSAAREHHPWSHGRYGPELLRHSDVEAMLHSPDLDQTGMAMMAFNGVTEGVLHDWWSMIMFASEGDRHRRLRNAVRSWLTPRRVAGQEVPLREACRRLIEDLPRGRTVDLAETVAARVPLTAVCLLLGVDTDRVAELGAAATDAGLAFGLFDHEERVRIEAALLVLLAWAEQAMVDARPGTLAHSIGEDADEGLLGRDEAVALMANLVFAAQDTTRFLIANTLWLMARHPEVWADLRAGRTTATAVVEESLRYFPPAMGTIRLATAPTRIGALELAPGDLLTASFWAAGRDPRAHRDPDAFLPGRHEGVMLSFGHGPHHCIGAALARMEATVVVETAAQHCPDLEIDWTEAALRPGRSAITGIERLPGIVR